MSSYQGAGVQIRYMGSKRRMAPLVARLIANLRSGPCLDLFAGMCSIAGALSNYGRPVWSNDIQLYSFLVAHCVTNLQDPPPSQEKAEKILMPWYESNKAELVRRFEADVHQERRALGSSDYQWLQGVQEDWAHAGNDMELAAEALELSKRPRSGPYRLATLTYAHGYFGLEQAIDIDSLRYAIDAALEGRLISSSDASWYLLAVLQSAGHLSASPGHFAEYFKPRDSNISARITRLRVRSPWRQFLIEIERLMPYGASAWRFRNKAFCAEAETLVWSLSREGVRPSVIYADPPYSRAQYSRYYHLLETLVRYDYPKAMGQGRYRPDRFQTPFSNISTVASAFRRLVCATAEVGADLVISYPGNGLLFQAGEDLRSILRSSYGQVCVEKTPGVHSTLGGSPGHESASVDELLYVARKPY